MSEINRSENLDKVFALYCNMSQLQRSKLKQVTCYNDMSFVFAKYHYLSHAQCCVLCLIAKAFFKDPVFTNFSLSSYFAANLKAYSKVEHFLKNSTDVEYSFEFFCKLLKPNLLKKGLNFNEIMNFFQSVYLYANGVEKPLEKWQIDFIKMFYSESKVLEWDKRRQSLRR